MVHGSLHGDVVAHRDTRYKDVNTSTSCLVCKTKCLAKVEEKKDRSGKKAAFIPESTAYD